MPRTNESAVPCCSARAIFKWAKRPGPRAAVQGDGASLALGPWRSALSVASVLSP